MSEYCLSSDGNVAVIARESLSAGRSFEYLRGLDELDNN